MNILFSVATKTFTVEFSSFAFLKMALAVIMLAASVGATPSLAQAPSTEIPFYVLRGEGSGSYPRGATVPIVANPGPSGQSFYRWYGYGATLADPTALSTTATIDPTVAVAYVVPIFTITPSPTVPPSPPSPATPPAPPAPNNTFTVTVTGGTGGGTFTAGTRVTIRANAPPAGQAFDRWTGTTAGLASVTAAETTLTVPSSNVAIAASYKAAVAPVTVSVTGGTGGGQFLPGERVTVRANPAPAGQVFDRWTGATQTLASITAAETTLTVPNAAVTVTATYRTVTSTTAAFELSSHIAGDTLSDKGETLVARVRDPATVASVTARLSTGRTGIAIDFDRTQGQVALRLFDEDVPPSGPVTVTFERRSSSGAAEASSFTFTGGTTRSAQQMIAGRLTFGLTPALFAQLRGPVDFRAWVETQLRPETIDDSGLGNPDTNVLVLTTDYSRVAPSIVHWQMHYAAYSRRQLNEVMTNFWNNHFWSIDREGNWHRNGVEEIKGFRSKAFGRFRDLLEVSAKSPQMLLYLNNTSNRGGKGGNENYTRELLELHTVGVRAGYGDADIRAIMQVLGGWGFRGVTQPDGVAKLGEFEFKPQDHIFSDKYSPWLNKTFGGYSGADGIKEGEQLLDILARHPSTRQFVCGKLVELLVSDSRPQSFIDKCAAAWERTDGVIAESLRAILLDPAYLSTAELQRSKLKTPFEYVVGFQRAFNVVARNNYNFYEALRGIVRGAGMDHVAFPVPTGFAERGGPWLGTATASASLARITPIITSQLGDGQPGQVGTLRYTQLVRDADMRTSEAVAAYLLTLATNDRFQRDEFEAVVRALKGSDGRFDPIGQDEEVAMRRAMGLIVALPSFKIQ